MESILAFLGLANIVMILAVLSQWRNLGRNAAKVMMFISLALFPTMWGVAIAQHNLGTAQNTSFCKNCHIMQPYFDSLNVDDNEPLSAVHYQNNWVPQDKACYTCHTSYTMFGGINAKLSGLRHMYVNYIKGPPEELKMYEPYQNRECLRCHGPSRKYQKTKEHRKTKDMLQEIAEGKQSCLARGCHELGHLIESEDDDEIIF